MDDLTTFVDRRRVCAPFPERPPLTSDDEWRAAKARAGTEIADGPMTIAVTVLRPPNTWTEPECKVFVGDDAEDQAEQAAWDHYETTGETSYVEVAQSWLDVGDDLGVTCTSYCPGYYEREAGHRFTEANRHLWIGAEHA